MFNRILTSADWHIVHSSSEYNLIIAGTGVLLVTPSVSPSRISTSVLEVTELNAIHLRRRLAIMATDTIFIDGLGQSAIVGEHSNRVSAVSSFLSPPIQITFHAKFKLSDMGLSPY